MRQGETKLRNFNGRKPPPSAAAHRRIPAQHTHTHTMFSPPHTHTSVVFPLSKSVTLARKYGQLASELRRGRAQGRRCLRGRRAEVKAGPGAAPQQRGSGQLWDSPVYLVPVPAPLSNTPGRGVVGVGAAPNPGARPAGAALSPAPGAVPPFEKLGGSAEAGTPGGATAPRGPPPSPPNPACPEFPAAAGLPARPHPSPRLHAAWGLEPRLPAVRAAAPRCSSSSHSGGRRMAGLSARGPGGSGRARPRPGVRRAALLPRRRCRVRRARARPFPPTPRPRAPPVRTPLPARPAAPARRSRRGPGCVPAASGSAGAAARAGLGASSPGGGLRALIARQERPRETRGPGGARPPPPPLPPRGRLPGVCLLS